MKITRKTTMRECAHLLNKGHIEIIKMHVTPEDTAVYGDWWTYSIADLEKICQLSFEPQTPVIAWVAKVCWVEKCLEQLNQFYENIKTNETFMERAAWQGVPTLDFWPSMICKAANYFRVNNLREAALIPIADVMLMDKQSAAAVAFQKNLNKLYSQKK